MPKDFTTPAHIKTEITELSRELFAQGYHQSLSGEAVTRYVANMFMRRRADDLENETPLKVTVLGPGLTLQDRWPHHIDFIAVQHGAQPPEYLAVGASEDRESTRLQAVYAVSLVEFHAGLRARDWVREEIFEEAPEAGRGNTLGCFELQKPRLVSLSPAA